MVENRQNGGRSWPSLRRHPVLWVLAGFGLVVFVVIVVWNLIDADLPLWPGEGAAAPVTSVTILR